MAEKSASQIDVVQRESSSRAYNRAKQTIEEAVGTTEAEDCTRAPGQRFDRELFLLKQSDLSDRMGRQSEAALPPSPSEASEIINPQIKILSKWLAETDRNAREVCGIQAREITPDFVRDVLMPEANALIDTRARAIRSILEGRLGLDHEKEILKLAWPVSEAINRLKAEIQKRYEIEVRSLGYRTENATLGKNLPKLPAEKAGLAAGFRDSQGAGRQTREAG